MPDEVNDEAQITNAKGMRKSENLPFCDEELFWSEGAESVVREKPETTGVYDLEERTARFGESVIDFAKRVPQDPVTNRLISQLVGAATSVGANYCEADDAVSKKAFLKNVAERKRSKRSTFSGSSFVQCWK